MSARILVVDDQPLNVKLLEVKLTAEYYDVITASDGVEALQKTRESRPDIILLDVMMPGMDGYEVCERLKADTALKHIPVIMVTALNDAVDRTHGIESGADDFLSKPINDTALFARVRSLLRVKTALDELRIRDNISLQFGIINPSEELKDNGEDGCILIIDADAHNRSLMDNVLAEKNQVICATGGEEAMAALSESFDLIIINADLGETDGLRVCSQIRIRDDTRNIPLLILIDEEDNQKLAKSLDLGVNDYLYKPIDSNELIAHAHNQIRHYRYQQRLLGNFRRSISMAITDNLTGLYNRHYLFSHLATHLDISRTEGRSLSIAMIDIDHFKSVNDNYGHAVGDEMLREMARRFEKSIRASDLATRIGGEEFVIVLTDTDMDLARKISARLCRDIEADRFVSSLVDGGVNVTVSIGVAMAGLQDKTPEDLIKRADDALYEAKHNGRNQVITAVG